MIFEQHENTITAYGTIWESDGMDFVLLLSKVEKEFSKITLRLHTEGGSVFSGNLIYNALRNSKADINIEIIGIAASMGAVIALSRPNVSIVENGFLMIHAPSGYVYGTADYLEDNARLLRSIEDNFVKKLISKTGKTEDYVRGWLSGDNWFSAQEALTEGLVSEIIESDDNIEHFEPQQLTSREAYYRIAAQLTSKNQNNYTMKKPLIEALKLVGVTEQSSDTAIIEAVQSQMRDIRDQLANEQQAHQASKQNLKAQFASVVGPMLDQAVKQGKITAEQKPTYQSIAEASGIEALNTVLGNLGARQPIYGGVAHGKQNPSDRLGWDFDKWQGEDPRGFEALSQSDPETFEQIVNQKFQK